MINTLNESSLHKTLKSVYSLGEGNLTEQPVGNWICDIVKTDGSVIEIQTSNVSKLLPKIQDLLHNGHSVTVVHPIIKEKKIELYNKTGTLVSSRKSPKKETVYSIFKELTGLYSILLEKKFTLEVPEITIAECRTQTNSPSQLINRSRRFLRPWIKTDKKLIAIYDTVIFNTSRTYLALLPKNIPQVFTAQDVARGIQAVKNSSAPCSQEAHLMLWVFLRMHLIQLVKTENRKHYYRCII